MPNLWGHIGFTTATLFATSYLNLTGSLKYGTNLVAITSTLLVLIRNKFLVPFMFLPSIFLSKTPSHIEFVNKARANIQSRFPETCSFITLTTKDKVRIDAMTLLHPDHVDVPLEQTKWIIWFNPNGASYEELLDFLVKYTQDAVGVSLLAFNYRGVARSSGLPETAQDLVTDGAAAMDYLLSKGVDSKNILVHGHSMGGAVASKLRAEYPLGPIINDRSFRSLNHAVTALVVNEPALGALAGGLVGAVIGGVVGGSVYASYPIAFSSALAGLVSSGFVGYHWGHLHAPIIKIALSALQWDFDVEASWKKISGHKVVIYHALDGVIHHEKASMFSSIGILTDEGKDSTKLMRLEYEHFERREAVTSRHQMYHVYPLDTQQKDWNAIVSEARKGLKI